MSQSPAGTVILVSLAMNQARFYLLLGKALEARGWNIAHICFHEGSHEWLMKEGARSFNPFAQGGAMADLAMYPGMDVEALLLHEQAAYEIRDTAMLRNKFRRHLHAVHRIFDELSRQAPGPTVVVQELGGFLSVLATYFEARRRKWTNYFIEPSFFRGRVFLTPDSLAAPSVAGPASGQVSAEVEKYLADAVAKQSIVVPLKDRAHYRKPIAKLIDRRNLRRLVEKFLDKYAFGKQEEFQHIGGHISRHARMYFSHRKLRPHYGGLPDLPFVYFPFHVPADMALTIRSPRFLDQIALVGKLAQMVPPGVMVVAKEHPALVGALSATAMLSMLDQHRNVVLLSPEVNNYTVLRKARAVITINSKSGAEALLLGKPVLVLGDAFYRCCRLVHAIDRPEDLPAILKSVIEAEAGPDHGHVACYFQDVWARSTPGELYDLAPENVGLFAESVDRQLRQAPADQESRP